MTSVERHSRPGRASTKSGYIRYCRRKRKWGAGLASNAIRQALSRARRRDAGPPILRPDPASAALLATRQTSGRRVANLARSSQGLSGIHRWQRDATALPPQPGASRMTRYFFNVMAAGNLIPDEEGMILPNVEAARREAFRSLADPRARCGSQWRHPSSGNFGAHRRRASVWSSLWMEYRPKH